MTFKKFFSGRWPIISLRFRFACKLEHTDWLVHATTYIDVGTTDD